MKIQLETPLVNPITEKKAIVATVTPTGIKLWGRVMPVTDFLRLFPKGTARRFRKLLREAGHKRHAATPAFQGDLLSVPGHLNTMIEIYRDDPSPQSPPKRKKLVAPPAVIMV